MVFRANKPNKTDPPELIVSGCLTGINCTYKGRSKPTPWLKSLADNHRVIAVCPEVMGGLKIPRENSEIVSGDGNDVIIGKAKVLCESGKDVTDNYLKGADKILRIAKKRGIKIAVLKSHSPACGMGMIYDGTFSNKLKKGNGVLTSVLISNGIKVYNESTGMKHLKRYTY